MLKPSRAVRLTALALLLLLLLPVAGLLWIITTETGTAWAAGLVRERLGDQITWRTLRGSLLGPLEFSDLRIEQPGLQLSSRAVTLSWQPRALLHRELRIDSLAVRDTVVVVGDTPGEEPGEPFRPSSLQLPLSLSLRGIVLRELELRRPGAPPARVESLAMAAHSDGDVVTLETFTARLPKGTVTLRGSTALRDAMPLDLSLVGDWRLPGESAAEIPVNFSASLEGTIDWADSIRGHLDYEFALEGMDRLAPELPTPLAARGSIAAVQEGASLRLDALKIDLDDLPLALNLQGDVNRDDAEAVAFTAALSWRGAQWPLDALAPLVSSPEGSIDLSGTLDDTLAYRVALTAALAGEQLPAGQWEGSAEGDDDTLTIETLVGELLGGQLRLSGPVSWSPEPGWKLEIDGTGLAVGTLVPEITGPLEARLQTAARLDPEGMVQATAKVGKLALEVLDIPVALTGDARLAGETLALTTLEVTSGANALRANGTLSPAQLALDWQLSSEEPGRFVPGAQGRVEGEGRIEGSPEAPSVQARLRGTALGWGTLAATSLALELRAGLAADAALDVELTAAGITDAGNPLVDTLSLAARGSNAAHTLELQIDAPGGQLGSRLEGGLSLAEAAWRGQLARLAGQAPAIGDFQLEAPASLSLAAERASLTRACLRGGERGESLCLAGLWQSRGDSTVDIDLDALPVEAFVPTLTGELSGGLSGAIAADGTVSAHGRFTLAPGEVLLPAGMDRPALAHGGGGLALGIDDGGLAADFDFVAPEDGSIAARVDLPALNALPVAAAQPLGGRLQASLPDLAILSALVPDIADSAGRLSADFAIAGTLEKPTIDGELSLRNGRARVPRAGLELSALELRAVSDAARPDSIALSGGLRSGSGQLTLDGSLNLTARSAAVTIAGDSLQIFDTADARVLLSPDLQLRWSDDTLHLRGLLQIPEADITPELRLSAATAEDPAAGELPGAVILPSPDVVVLGEETGPGNAPVTAEAPFRIDASVDLLFGDDVQVHAVGLNARIGGGLNFRLYPDQAELIPIGRGAISLEDGTFRSFGQDLDIETGQLIFAAVPITEPELYLSAVRWIDNDPDVTAAGVLVTGPVAAPNLELFSRPQLESSAIQSYLLTGSASGGGDSVLRFGTYLTERFYVGYGYNLLEETSEFDALFSIMPRFGVGADVGEADSNFNLTFSYER